MYISNINNISFGLNRESRVRETSPVSKKTYDIIKFKNGKCLHISSNYLFNKTTDTLFTLFNKAGRIIKHVLKVYSKDGNVHKI